MKRWRRLANECQETRDTLLRRKWWVFAATVALALASQIYVMHLFPWVILAATLGGVLLWALVTGYFHLLFKFANKMASRGVS